jgi:hypothetical protein
MVGELTEKMIGAYIEQQEKALPCPKMFLRFPMRNQLQPK